MGGWATGAHEGFAQGGEEARERDGFAGDRPGRAVHLDQPLRPRVGRPEEQDFEAFVTGVILNRNSQVCLHQPRQPQPLAKINRARRRAQTEC